MYWEEGEMVSVGRVILRGKLRVRGRFRGELARRYSEGMSGILYQKITMTHRPERDSIGFRGAEKMSQEKIG